MNTHNGKKCPETSSTLMLYLYGEAENPRAFEAHIESCAECRASLAAHRQTLQAYRAEIVTAPRFVREAAKPSLWDRVRDYFSMPMVRPVFSGATTMIALALIALIAVHSHMPFLFTAEVPSYTDMESRMDSIDTELDSLFAMSAQNEFTAEGESELKSHAAITNLDSELDDIRDGVYNF